jgi:DNA-binding transcriptional MocR family regulator
MDEHWRHRLERWQEELGLVAAPSAAERLYGVIRAEVEAGALAPGELLPSAERIAPELAMRITDVRAAYARLAGERLIVDRTHGVPFVPARDAEPIAGNSTHGGLEAALLQSVKEAAARGLCSEAAERTRATMLRMRAMKQIAEDDEDDDDD